MIRRLLATTLLALPMLFGVASASSGDATASSDAPSEPTEKASLVEESGDAARPAIAPTTGGSEKSGGGSCGAPAETMSTGGDDGESAHPCDTACDCCGYWGVEACCDKCWSCWYGS